jgi:hypothetical protein
MIQEEKKEDIKFSREKNSNFYISIWRFIEYDKETSNNYKVASHDFLERLHFLGFFYSGNWITGTGFYYEFPIEGSNKYSLDLYKLNNSLLKIKTFEQGNKVQNFKSLYWRDYSILTPRGFFNKFKHKDLERSLNYSAGLDCFIQKD